MHKNFIFEYLWRLIPGSSPSLTSQISQSTFFMQPGGWNASVGIEVQWRLSVPVRQMVNVDASKAWKIRSFWRWKPVERELRCWNNWLWMHLMTSDIIWFTKYDAQPVICTWFLIPWQTVSAVTVLCLGNVLILYGFQVWRCCLRPCCQMLLQWFGVEAKDGSHRNHRKPQCQVPLYRYTSILLDNFDHIGPPSPSVYLGSIWIFCSMR